MSFQDLEAGRGPETRSLGFVNGTQLAVTSGIFQINSAVSTFQRLFVNALSTPKVNTPALREKLLVKDTSETDHRVVVHEKVSTNNKISRDDANTSSYNPPFVENCTRQQEVLLDLDNEITFNEAIIEEREQAIEEIQQQIRDVHEIFKDLAVLVQQQGIMIDDIGSNIEGSCGATTQAKSELVKASETQRSNNSVKCLLLVVFCIVLLILMIVLAA